MLLVDRAESEDLTLKKKKTKIKLIVQTRQTMSEFTAPVTVTAVSVPSTTSPLSLGEGRVGEMKLLGSALQVNSFVS